MWQQPRVSAKRNSGTLVRWGSYEGPRCVYYPFDTLLAGDTSVYKTASFIVNDEKGLVSDGIDGDVLLPDDHDVEATQLVNNVDGKRIMILEEFSEALPVTAVFVTNVKSFVLEHEGEAPFTIKREDVDWQGVLLHNRPSAKLCYNGLAEACRREIYLSWEVTLQSL